MTPVWRRPQQLPARLPSQAGLPVSHLVGVEAGEKKKKSQNTSPRASFAEERAELICFSFCITTTPHLQETSDAQN